jgi:glyoxylate reductase
MRQFARAEIACRNSEPLQRLHLMALQCGSDHVSDQWKKQLPLARDPEHKTLGIIGLGGIGQVVARRMALGWNTTVIYHNRRPLASLPDGYYAEYKATVEELLAEADIVSIHLPVSPACPVE